MVYRCRVLLLCFVTASSAWANERLTFERNIRPILKIHCFHCHGDEKELSGGLDLQLVRLIKHGGDSGAAIVPHNPSASLLWQKIDSGEMPAGPKKLPADQKEMIRRWISQGAATERMEPDNPIDARFSIEELEHWAFQPVRQPPISTPAGYELLSPVDGFIANKLADHDLPFSSPTDRPTWIRRVTFGVTGLPPTPDEVEQFVADDSPAAFERLVDRLLASPQFGVRWGRHWLDVAGFAESNGGQEGDVRRPFAWRYRDYVIQAFNSGKPVDTFILEQLAGDELIEGDIDIHNPKHLELLSATGFMRMAPDATESSDTLVNRNAAIAETVKVISSTMLGLTVGCAQCHNHKYDPIAIDDYYRFRAIFDPAFPLNNWQLPRARLVDFTTSDLRAESDRIEASAKALEDDLNERRQALGKKIQELKLADVPEEVREATRTAVLTEPAKRTEQQKGLLDQYPMVKPVPAIIGLLIEYDMPAYREFEKEMGKIAAIRATKPPPNMVMATREQPNVLPVSSVFFRGDPESPRERVSPGELNILARGGRGLEIPSRMSTTGSTGRRLTYARHLTHGAHPLTPRVFVNRVWQQYVGRGLVTTPGDFGLSGAKPTHPQLLDWLAATLVNSSWDQKRLHRTILLSSTYRQSSRRTERLDAIDPENDLVGRMNLRRLEAESIRDSILFVAGQLNECIGGPSVPVTEDPEGKVVIGRRQMRDGLKTGVDSGIPEATRRSVFIEVQRRLPLNVLATFDQPDMNPNCELRRPSTVVTQALWFLNDRQMVDVSEKLAGQLVDRESDHSQIQELFLRLFAVPPSADEMTQCLEFLRVQQPHLTTQSAGEEKTSVEDGRRKALAALCQVLLASNRFLYAD